MRIMEHITVEAITAIRDEALVRMKAITDHKLRHHKDAYKHLYRACNDVIMVLEYVEPETDPQ